jgi:hypothetical protein
MFENAFSTDHKKSSVQEAPRQLLPKLDAGSVGLPSRAYRVPASPDQAPFPVHSFGFSDRSERGTELRLRLDRAFIFEVGRVGAQHLAHRVH